MLKKIKIKVEGVHCQSCKTLIEAEAGALEGVKDIDLDYRTGECQIEFDDGKISRDKIFEKIEKLNYKVKEADPKTPKRKISKDLIVAGLLAVAFVSGYFLIKQFGLLEVLSKLNEKQLSYWLIFFIGFLVSFHCIGMCGSLVVTYSARRLSGEKEKKTNPFFPHLQYNLGRMFSYTMIGAVLGGIGSFFIINPTFTGIIVLLAGFFMILMGLSLLTNFWWLEKVRFKTPSFIAGFLYNQKHSEKPKGPLLIGLLNGFMPCGPLQAVQLYALATGSVIQGALSMGIYALGTIPLMFGFGAFISLISQERIKLVMKLSGAVVMVLALFMINRGLVNLGYGFKGFVPEESISQTEDAIAEDAKEYQIVNMDLTYQGYSPNVLFIKKGIPVRWVINVKQMSGCTNEILLPDYNIRKKLVKGENIIEFFPDKVGDIKFSCWMKMVWGKFVVTI